MNIKQISIWSLCILLFVSSVFCEEKQYFPKDKRWVEIEKIPGTYEYITDKALLINVEEYLILVTIGYQEKTLKQIKDQFYSIIKQQYENITVLTVHGFDIVCINNWLKNEELYIYIKFFTYEIQNKSVVFYISFTGQANTQEDFEGFCTSFLKKIIFNEDSFNE